MAVTGSNPVLGIIVAGQNIVESLTLANDYATDAGSLQPLAHQIKRDSGPWKTLGSDETAILGENVQIRTLAFNGSAVGAAFMSSVVTVTAPAITGQVASFGASTLSGQGGFRPVDGDGVELVLTGIVSGGATTPPAQIVNGRLSFAGVGAPNGAVIRVAHATGEVDVTISTAAGKSIATPQELAVALNAQRTAVAPINLYMRPGYYDVNNGGASPNGIFQSRNIPQAGKATVRRHPGQTARYFFYKPNADLNSYWYSTSWIEFDGGGLAYIDNRSQIVTSGRSIGSTPATNTHDLTFRDFQIIGPDVPESALNDPTKWVGTGYTGVLAVGPKLNSAYNISMIDVEFRNVQTGGDYGAEGLIIDRCHADKVYFDYLRIIPQTENALAYPTVTLIRDVTAVNFFAINNEIVNTPTEKAPHNDFVQVIGGQCDYLVMIRCGLVRGPYRGDVVASLQQNARMNRPTYHECMLFHQGVSWGMNNAGSYHSLMNQCTFSPIEFVGSTAVRYGVISDQGSFYAEGPQRISNSYIVTTSGTTPVSVAASLAADPAYIVNENSYYPTSTSGLVQMQGPATPLTIAAAKLAARPIPGSYIDLNGIGAIGLDGEFRGTECPPVSALAPDLATSGGNIIITTKAPIYSEATPTVWEWCHRSGDGETWSAWTEVTGATATATGLAQAGRQFMYRWQNAAGVAGVPSEVGVLP